MREMALEFLGFFAVFQNGVRCIPHPRPGERAGKRDSLRRSIGTQFRGNGTLFGRWDRGISRWDPDPRTGSLVLRRPQDGFGGAETAISGLYGRAAPPVPPGP